MLWEVKTLTQNLKIAKLEVNNEVTPPSLSTNGANSAMAKLSESLVKNQEAAFKANKEKTDNTLKFWRKFPKIQQDIILLGGGRGE